MRTFACAPLMLMVLMVMTVATVAPAAEVYSWRDRQGQQHFSNVAVPGANVIHVEDAPPTAPTSAPPAGQDEGEVLPAGVAPPGAGADDAFVANASLRRQALERDLRDATRRLAALDAQLAALVHTRKKNARGADAAATGGVLPSANVRSDEETALAASRDPLAKRVADLHGEYAKLRTEVSSRLGGTPPWWIDVP